MTRSARRPGGPRRPRGRAARAKSWSSSPGNRASRRRGRRRLPTPSRSRAGGRRAEVEPVTYQLELGHLGVLERHRAVAEHRARVAHRPVEHPREQLVAKVVVRGDVAPAPIARAASQVRAGALGRHPTGATSARRRSRPAALRAARRTSATRSGESHRPSAYASARPRLPRSATATSPSSARGSWPRAHRSRTRGARRLRSQSASRPDTPEQPMTSHRATASITPSRFRTRCRGAPAS